jgi:dTDP-4-dehydrorhamnose reductase
MERSSSADGTSLKTYRPKNMRMNCFKCENELSITLPTLHDEIKRAAKEYL